MQKHTILVALVCFFAVSAGAHAYECTGQPDGAACNDANPCTENDVCSAEWCAGTAVPDGTVCDDGNMCTQPDTCRWGWCMGSALPDGTVCNDANPCTTGERCRAGDCAGSVPFEQPTTSPIAASEPVAVGDFNLDGKPDLVVLSASDSSLILILLGDGEGGFAQASTVRLASTLSSSSIVVADLNLDGRPDIVVQNYAAQSGLSVLLGNGAGGFVPLSGPALGSFAIDLATGDFNNDGKPDLASLGQSSKKVTILLGDGSGGFLARSPVAAGPSPASFATGDFNRDGALDLAVANPVSPTGGVTILLGDGSGGLAPGPAASPGPTGASSIGVGDFDQDGDQDLAVADSGFASTSISIFPGDGHGGFPYRYSLGVTWTPGSLAAADIDLDGQLDLVVGYSNVDAVGVFLGRGAAYFRQALGSPITLSGDRVTVATGDFDRDGRPDIVAATSHTTEARILLNRSEGMPCPGSDDCTVNVCNRVTGKCYVVPKFAGNACDDHDLCTTNDGCVQGACIGAGVTCAALDTCHQPGTCDPETGCSDVFTADGAACDDADACTQVDACEAGVCVGGNPVTCTATDQCKMGTCNPASGLCATIPRPEGTLCDDGGSCTAGDACHAGSCVSALSFVSSPGSPVPVGLHPGPIAIANLNADGHQDLAVVNVEGDTVTVLAGNGAGGFTPMSGSPIAALRLPDSIATGDFNQDGLTDLAVTSYYSNPSGWLTVFLRTSGGFVTAPDSPLALGKNPGSLVAGDFNHDGRTDLVLALDDLPDEARWYWGDGTGRFVWSGARFRPSSDIISLRVGDLDLDGSHDLVVVKGFGSLSIVFGFAYASTRLDLTAAGGCWGAAVGDVNVDGSPDIVCPGQANLTVFLGDGHRHFVQAPVAPFSSGPYFADAKLADFNLDGRPDLAVTKGSSPDAVLIFLGDGTGRFAEAACSPILGLGRLGELVTSDFNSDGRPDFAAVSFDLNAVGVYLGSPLLAANGSSCSDGNACTGSDTCQVGACAGNLMVPAEVNDSVRVSESDGAAVISWDLAPCATSSALMRGLVSGLPVGPGGGDEVCLAGALPNTTSSWTDAANPPPSNGFWYLVRGNNAAGRGPYGFQEANGTPTVPRESTTCP